MKKASEESLIILKEILTDFNTYNRLDYSTDELRALNCYNAGYLKLALKELGYVDNKGNRMKEVKINSFIQELQKWAYKRRKTSLHKRDYTTRGDMPKIVFPDPKQVEAANLATAIINYINAANELKKQGVDYKLIKID